MSGANNAQGYPNAPQTPSDPLATGLGLKAWNVDWGSMSGSLAPTSQTIYATAIRLPFGLPITILAMTINTAASGTAITAGFLGLCSPTTMIAQSASLGTAAASYPTGPINGPLAGSVTSYTTNPADSPLGIWYVMVLLNGTFGTTQPTFRTGGSVAGTGGPPITGGALIQYGTAGTGQTVLPANGAAVALVTGSTCYAVGVT